MSNQGQTFSGCLQPRELQGCVGRGCAKKLWEALPAGSARARRPRFPGSSHRPAPHVGCARGRGSFQPDEQACPASRRAPRPPGPCSPGLEAPGLSLRSPRGWSVAGCCGAFCKRRGCQVPRQTWFCQVSADAA